MYAAFPSNKAILKIDLTKFEEKHIKENIVVKKLDDEFRFYHCQFDEDNRSIYLSYGDEPT